VRHNLQMPGDEAAANEVYFAYFPYPRYLLHVRLRMRRRRIVHHLLMRHRRRLLPRMRLCLSSRLLVIPLCILLLLLLRLGLRRPRAGAL
jgi:hypothetical protein